MFILYLLAFIGLTVSLIFATVFTETEQFGWATVLLIGSVVVAQLLHIVNVLVFVSTHAGATVVYVVAYVVIGIIWSFIKWYSFLLNTRNQYHNWRDEFLAQEGLSIHQNLIPDAKLFAFKAFISRQSNYSYQDPIADLVNGKRPRAANNKTRIVSWMSLWPCSVIGTVLNDPIRKLFNFLFSWFKGLYQKMSDQVFRNDGELK